MPRFRYPDDQPYGGAFKELIPHLTLADQKTEAELEVISVELSAVAQDYLPIETRVTEVWLMTRRNNLWEKRASFALRS